MNFITLNNIYGLISVPLICCNKDLLLCRGGLTDVSLSDYLVFFRAFFWWYIDTLMARNITGNVTSSSGCLLLCNGCIWASKFRLHGSTWSLGRWNIIWEFSPISRFMLISLSFFFFFVYLFPLTFLIWIYKQMITNLSILTAFTIWISSFTITLLPNHLQHNKIYKNCCISCTFCCAIDGMEANQIEKLSIIRCLCCTAVKLSFRHECCP
jgi:hypothetical protein